MIKIIAADWILPVADQPIRNGIILLNDNIIEFAGCRSDFVNRYDISHEEIESMTGYVVLPSLVNAHTHLYFDSYADRSSSWANFPEWLEIAVRHRDGISTEEIANTILLSAEKMYEGGVSLVGNICSDFFRDGDIVEKSVLRGVNYLEVAGFASETKTKLNETIDQLKLNNNRGGNFKYIPSPHSIYSCDADTINRLKLLSEGTSLPFSIHLAESKEETEFISKNSGKLKNFLIKRGIPNNFLKKEGLSPVKYLHSIGGLHRGMTAVHCVHVDDEDIEILSENSVRIVICPGSNRFLGSGTAPLQKFLNRGITTCIGTDSSASNEELDIFREMRIIKEEHPTVHSSEIIRMATINGAESLGFDDRFGSIERGKQADLIALPLPDDSGNWEPSHVEDYIVSKCKGELVVRLNM